MGTKNDFDVDATEDASMFKRDILSKYDVVIFMSTTKDVLDDVQQNEFIAYIQSGGRFVGVHAGRIRNMNGHGTINWWGHGLKIIQKLKRQLFKELTQRMFQHKCYLTGGLELMSGIIIKTSLQTLMSC